MPVGPKRDLCPVKATALTPPFIHANREKTRCLSHIENKRDTLFSTDRSNLIDGLNGSQDIGGMRENDERGVRVDGLSHGHRIDEALRPERNEIKTNDALLAKMMEGSEDRIVFETGADNTAAWFDQSLDQCVQCICCIVRENNPLRIASSEKLADLTPDAHDPLFGFHGKIIASPSRRDAQAGISSYHLF
jgi:hypothetical protein